MADTNTFKLQIISPDRIFFDEDVEMAELRTTEGNIGILKGHIPLTAVTVPGVLVIHQNGTTKEAAVHDGFFEILHDKVTLLAEACEWPEEIDVSRAEAAKARAEEHIANKTMGTDLKRAEFALRRALTRIDIANK